MSATVLTPTVAAVTSAWNNEEEALISDDVFATSVSLHDWMYLHTVSGGPIPTLDDIIGIEIYIDQKIDANTSPDPPLPDALPVIEGEPVYYAIQAVEVALTLDGINPYGKVFLIPYWTDRPIVTLGGPTELFGSIWSAPEFNTSSFGFLIRVPNNTDLRYYAEINDFDYSVILSRPANMTGPIVTTTYFLQNSGSGRKLDFIRGIIYHTSPVGSLTMERETVRQQIRFGKESIHGTAVACTHNARSIVLAPQPQASFKSWRPQGAKLEQLHMLIKEWATSSITGIPTYTEMGYWLASVIGAPVSNGGVADELNTHVFRFENRQPQDMVSYTCEYGTPSDRAHRIKYALFDQFGIRFTRDDAEVNGSVISHKLEDGITMSGGADAVQNIIFTGTPTGGTFKLSYKGEITAAITYSTTTATTASNIQTALLALSNIPVSGVTVAHVSGTTYAVTFGGALADLQQPAIQKYDNSLTGGTTPNFTIEIDTSGGLIDTDLVPILPDQIDIYLSSDLNTIDSSKLTRGRLAEWTLGDRANPYWVLDTDQAANFMAHSEGQVTSKFGLKLQADSNGMALLAAARANNEIQWIKIVGTGPDIGATSDPHRLTILAPVRISGYGALEDDEGIYHANYELSTVEDPSVNDSVTVTLENGLTGY